MRHAGGAVKQPIIRNTKSEFGNRLKIRKIHQDDLIHQHAVRVLQQYNQAGNPKQPFQSFANPLRIDVLSAQPAACEQEATATAVYLISRRKLFVKLRLRLLFGSESDSMTPCVQVQLGDKFELLENWLTKLPPSDLSLVGPAGYSCQFDWTCATGQVFRFTDLPPELQDHALLNIMGKRVALEAYRQPGGCLSDFSPNGDSET